MGKQGEETTSGVICSEYGNMRYVHCGKGLLKPYKGLVIEDDVMPAAGMGKIRLVLFKERKESKRGEFTHASCAFTLSVSSGFVHSSTEHKAINIPKDLGMNHSSTDPGNSEMIPDNCAMYARRGHE